MGLVGWKPNPYDPIFLYCFGIVVWVIRPVIPVPTVTYNVFGGTLSLTQPTLSIYDDGLWGSITTDTYTKH